MPHVRLLYGLERFRRDGKKSSLNHKSFRDAVERGAVVHAGGRHTQKAAHMRRRAIGKSSTVRLPIDVSITTRCFASSSTVASTKGSCRRRFVANRRACDLDAFGGNVLGVGSDK